MAHNSRKRGLKVQRAGRSRPFYRDWDARIHPGAATLGSHPNVSWQLRGYRHSGLRSEKRFARLSDWRSAAHVVEQPEVMKRGGERLAANRMVGGGNEAGQWYERTVVGEGKSGEDGS